MRGSRPVNINPFTMRFPVTAIVSILHRISGVLIFLALPLILYTAGLAAVSEEGFNLVMFSIREFVLDKLVCWAVLAVIGFHVFAGVRHLIMDMGYFEECKAARVSAYLVFILTAAWVIILGVKIW